MRHRFHALCPYFAMFPEDFARRWIEDLTRPGDLVLDPFCGRGTTPFQAVLSDREAVGVDINPVAYCVTRAKTNAPKPAALRTRWTKLQKAFDAVEWQEASTELPDFFHSAFSPLALRQLLYLRTKLSWQESNVDCMLAALILGALHGESGRSSNYLSNQMPRTISTKPAYSLRFWLDRGLVAPERDVFLLIRGRIDFRYATPPPARCATVFRADFRDLPFLMQKAKKKADLVITSPPYLDITNFQEDQWLRGWFLGGPPYPRKTSISRDDRCRSSGRYWRLIADAWRVIGRVVRPGAHVVIRIGGKRLKADHIVSGLTEAGTFSQREIRLVSWEVSKLQKKQTSAFRPGADGCAEEVDACFTIA